jgi:hypothetical protein
VNRAWIIIVSGLLLAAVACAGIYYVCTASQFQIERSASPELAWLKEEFHLSDSELNRISRLHEQYMEGCAERCRLIDQKNTELSQRLAASDRVTPEIARLLSEAAQLRADCQKAMLDHFFEVSRTMPPVEGKRYLSWIQKQTILLDTHATMHR